MNKKLPIALGVLAGGLVLGALVYGSMTVTQAECDVCVEYRDARQCRRGSGVDESEAEDAAIRAACATLAQGMDESIACQNTRPVSVTCG